jgi:hypothetical protein
MIVGVPKETFPGERRVALRLVMVHTAVHKQPAFDPGEREAFARRRGLVRGLGG